MCPCSASASTRRSARTPPASINLIVRADAGWPGSITGRPRASCSARVSVGHRDDEHLAVGVEPRQRVAGSHASRLGEQRAVAPRARDPGVAIVAERREPDAVQRIQRRARARHRHQPVRRGVSRTGDERPVGRAARRRPGDAGSSACRMGPGREGVAPTPADAHNHAERQGTIDPRRCGRAGGCTRGRSSMPPTRRGWSPRRRRTAWSRGRSGDRRWRSSG